MRFNPYEYQFVPGIGIRAGNSAMHHLFEGENKMIFTPQFSEQPGTIFSERKLAQSFKPNPGRATS